LNCPKRGGSHAEISRASRLAEVAKKIAGFEKTVNLKVVVCSEKRT
jgi:hypothetical protein